MITTRFCSKKYFIFFLLICFSFFHAQKKMTIVLDAGHGGSDHGTNRNYTSLGYLAEKDITLNVTLLVGQMLEKHNDFKVIYTRKTDTYPSLTERTNLANRSKADLFVSIHVNGVTRTGAFGTETYVQGPDQNDDNLDVAKRENDVIFLDEEDKKAFGSYDPKSPESLIALRIQQSRYLEKSLILGGLVEENFAKKDNRFSRGVKQKNLHVLRLNAMPSVLVEIGFVSNPEEASYISSTKGQKEIAQSIYNAIISYKNRVERKGGTDNYTNAEPEKVVEEPLKNDFRVLLMSTRRKYNTDDPVFRGLKYILTVKERDLYKYYYAVTNYASQRDKNLKTVKDIGFKNAYAVGFVPDQSLNIGYYTIELAVSKHKLDNDSPILKTLKDVQREKNDGYFYYTYGKVQTLEDAINLQKTLDARGIKNTVIQKVVK